MSIQFYFLLTIYLIFQNKSLLFLNTSISFLTISGDLNLKEGATTCPDC